MLLYIDNVLTYSEVDVSCSVSIATDNITILFVTDTQTVPWIKCIARMTIRETKILCLNQSLQFIAEILVRIKTR